MKIIVGLGNPGEKYAHNRHNIGFVAVDKLNNLMTHESWAMSKKFDTEMIQKNNLILAKPTTYMNDSGVAVAKIFHFYQLKSEDVYIIHDDLDITLGKYKIQLGKAPKVHNGLLSVEQKLGTDKYWNVRIGVENRDIRGNGGVPGVVYSLQNFNDKEQQIVDGVVEQVTADLLTRLS